MLVSFALLSFGLAATVCPISDLNIRDSPSLNGTVLWVASAWEVFALLSAGDWDHVQALSGPHSKQIGYASAQYLGSCRKPGTAMPWMCLERCGENIDADFQQIKTNSHSLTAVSPEGYDLGPSANLVWNGFTRISPQITALGLQVYPMITTVDINKLRTLFANDTAFIADAVAECVKMNYTGYHIDFEPCQDAHPTCTDQDALAYAKFLDRFASALHAQRKTINVAIATWNVFWNFTALGKTSVDLLITMGTYAYTMSEWQQELDFALKTIPLDQLGVGLCSDCVSTPYSDSDLQARFASMAQAKATHLAIWESPIPTNWWPWLSEWAHPPE